jgi:hypothetical protein
MKANHLFSYAIIFTILTFACNKNSDIGPSTKIELFNNTSNTLIGSPITKVIGVAGGNINLQSAGANVIVPAGAMAAGAAITVQAISDVLDNEGQGIQISGDWTKPIWLEFSYPLGERNPENNLIAFKTSTGAWIASQKVKVDKAKGTIAIRLGQTTNAKARQANAKTTAGTYSFAASHEFFLKPDQASINIGESVSFTAFAKAGDTDGYWIKKKDGTYFYDDGELASLTKLASESTTNNNPDDDDYLVPLTPISKTNVKDADDELVPLTKVIKEAAFTNKKPGFTRSWILMEGPGTLNPTGNIGAKYTAPNDASAKGKIARVTFFSKNDKTKQDLEASATIRIKDGLKRYSGTLSTTIKADYSNTQEKIMKSYNYEAKVTFITNGDGNYKVENDKLLAQVNEYTYIYESKNGNHYTKSYISGPANSEGLKDKGGAYMHIKSNLYNISGAWYIKGINNLNVETVDFGKKAASLSNFEITVGNGLSFSTFKEFPVTDKKFFKGSNVLKQDNDVITSTWNLILEE